jgi:hypothetical protein
MSLTADRDLSYDGRSDMVRGTPTTWPWTLGGGQGGCATKGAQKVFRSTVKRMPSTKKPAKAGARESRGPRAGVR